MVVNKKHYLVMWIFGQTDLFSRLRLRGPELTPGQQNKLNLDRNVGHVHPDCCNFYHVGVS